MTSNHSADLQKFSAKNFYATQFLPQNLFVFIKANE
jgi:hypothetical protein